MLESLRLVRGVVAEGKLLTVLSHFHITPHGRVYGSDGKLTLSAPVEPIHDKPVTVPAVPFLKAVDACNGEPNITISDELHRMNISKGRFRARIPLANDVFYLPRPEGERFELDGVAFLAMLRRLRPFVSADASRPWSLAVKVQGGSAYATNNVILARAPCDVVGPVIIPSHAIDELLRIGKPPTAVKCGRHGVFFFCEGDVNLHSVICADPWPDLDPVFQRAEDSANEWSPAGRELLSAVETLAPFCEDKDFPVLEFDGDVIRTKEGNMSAEMEGVDVGQGRFHFKQLRLILSSAQSIDLSSSPHRFQGDGVEGVFMGVVDVG